ncbi:MAG: hypothetical protein M3165_01920 [Actinomycetota bacterium]|nr:hypothetical protein [Actinomycetota bacterium]
MVDRSESTALAETAAPVQDASWMLVDLLASIVGYDGCEVAVHLAAMSARGSTEGQVEIVAGLWRCDHPHVPEALDLLGRHHPDPVVAREARKAAIRARGRLAGL